MYSLPKTRRRDEQVCGREFEVRTDKTFEVTTVITILLCQEERRYKEQTDTELSKTEWFYKEESIPATTEWGINQRTEEEQGALKDGCLVGV
jgi:hypothetical protein